MLCVSLCFFSRLCCACTFSTLLGARKISLTPRTHTHTTQTRALVDAPLLPLLLGGAYAVVAWQAWQAGLLQQVASAVRASLPAADFGALARLFQCPTLTCLAWLHLLLLDFWMAR